MARRVLTAIASLSDDLGAQASNNLTSYRNLSELDIDSFHLFDLYVMVVTIQN